MKNLVLNTSSFLILVICLFAFVAFKSNGDSTAKTNKAMIEHGSYLVNVIGCDHCHSPKEMTPEGPRLIAGQRLSGYQSNRPLPDFDRTLTKPGNWALMTQDLLAAAGPWGVSFGANLTPHETGIGNWTYAHFEKSMREGKHKGLENGRMVMPPMPWDGYRQLNDDDMRSIFAFLKSMPAVDNVVPTYQPPVD